MSEQANTVSERTRDVLRERWKAKVPRWYSPWLHLLANFALTAVAIGGLVHVLRAGEIRPSAWLAVPLSFLLANLLEWLMHRGPMHRRRYGMERLFRRHTLQHHRYFTYEHMAIGSHRELFFVIFPVQFAVLSFVVTALVWLGLRASFGPDVASLSAITVLGYFLLIEWMHLATHLPMRWFERLPLRGRVMRFLRAFHRVHHDPRLMNRFNFNITLPITDWVLGTIHGRRSPVVTEPTAAESGHHFAG